ncbi:MAG: hypothetical protein RAK21_10275 [Synechococcus sp. SP2 MAG]|jgi:hypothetical protein|nr:hypothetical protein [Synechococcus sp. SP2 MAG]
MKALILVAVVLVNLALIFYLGEKVFSYWKRFKDLKNLVNDHPEMRSVEPEQGLLGFESDDVIRALVLDNDEPGESEPYLATLNEEEED